MVSSAICIACVLLAAGANGDVTCKENSATCDTSVHDKEGTSFIQKQGKVVDTSGGGRGGVRRGYDESYGGQETYKPLGEKWNTDAPAGFGESPFPQYKDGSPLGLPGSSWHPMAIELEFFECQSEAEPIAEVLMAEDNYPWLKTTDYPGDTALWLRAASVRLNRILKAIPGSASETAGTQLTSMRPFMRSMWVKESHDDQGVLHSWNLEKEKTEANLLEISTPCDLSEEETKLVIKFSHGLIGRYHGGHGSSSQSHVESRGLLSDDRLVGLLLLWERYHDALFDFVQVRQRGNEYAGSIALRNPPLLTALQQRWKSGGKEPLEKVFLRHASSIVNLQGPRDGYRRFAINVCHLLQVDCCQNCPKNLVPKFGSVEFRMFNTEFGPSLRLELQLMQRMIQRSHDMPISEFRKWTLNHGEKPATSVYSLFDLLGLPHEDMNAAFLNGGAMKWKFYCTEP